jgi:hypothetical protein
VLHGIGSTLQDRRRNGTTSCQIDNSEDATHTIVRTLKKWRADRRARRSLGRRCRNLGLADGDV